MNPNPHQGLRKQVASSCFFPPPQTHACLASTAHTVSTLKGSAALWMMPSPGGTATASSAGFTGSIIMWNMQSGHLCGSCTLQHDLQLIGCSNCNALELVSPFLTVPLNSSNRTSQSPQAQGGKKDKPALNVKCFLYLLIVSAISVSEPYQLL